MEIKNEYVIRNIAGDNVLVPIGNSVNSFNGLVILNDIAKFIWEKMPEAKDEDELVDFILEEYEIDRETAKADLNEFLELLRRENVI